MSGFESTVTNNDAGSVTQTRANGKSHVLLMPNGLTEHPRTGQVFTDLNDAIATTAEMLTNRAPDLTVTGFNKVAIDAVARNIAPAFQAAQKAVPSAIADLDKRSSTFDKPHFTDDQPHGIRVENRQYGHTLSLPDLIAATRRDPLLAASIIEGGEALSRLPSDIWDRLNEELRINNATRVLSFQGDYRTEPSATDPIGGKPDHAKARAMGERLIAAFDAERELLASAPDTLASVVEVVALMTDATRESAFTALTAA